MRSAEELRELVDDALARLTFHDDLSGLDEAIRYALDGGGKRVRPVLCLMVAEACGADIVDVLPAA